MDLLSCSGVDFSSWHFPYMMRVEQGNIVTKSQLQNVKLGMNSAQVKFILGDSVVNTAESNEMLYIYQLYNNNTKRNSYSINLYFESDMLIKIESKGI